MAQRLKCLPAMQETWVQSLGQEDPLEKEMATHSSILAWRIPGMEETRGWQSTVSQRIRHDWPTSLSLSNYIYICVCVYILYTYIYMYYTHIYIIHIHTYMCIYTIYIYMYYTYIYVCIIHIYIYMRRKWQTTAVFLPGKSNRQSSLVGYSPWVTRVRHDLVTKSPPPHILSIYLYMYIPKNRILISFCWE